MENRQELLSSLIVVAFGVAVVALSGGIDTVAAIEKSGVINSRFFPRLMGLFFVGLGGLLLLRSLASLRRPKAAEGSEDASSDTATDQSAVRLAIAIVIAVLYAVLFRPIGFPIATFFAVTAYSYLLGSPRGYVPPIIGAAVAVLLYVAFRYALGLLLPLGILSGIL